MKIELASGRSISLSQFTQSRVNAGLLSGKPSASMNDDKILGVVESARQLASALGEPLLIEPRRTTVPDPTGRGPPRGEWLPAIACIAVFDSGALARADSEPYSSLVVVWFQDQFALPIDESILARIKAIEWDACATDWCP